MYALPTRIISHTIHPRPSIILRYASTHPPNPTITPAPPPKTPLSPTTFAEKSSPRQVHERPERTRGLPPSGKKAPWEVEGKTAVPSGTVEPGIEHAFAGPSRPRMVYERPAERELPRLKNRIPLYIALASLGLGAWGLFLLHATNSERLSSSVLRQVTFQLRNSPEVAAILGDNVRLGDNWWGFGESWINGTINLMQGRVDLKFRIQGSQGAGTVYFTSIRPQQEGAWRIVRYKVIADSGEVVRLEDQV